MQILDLKEYAHSMGYQIYRIYEDKGYSGSNTKRPMLTELFSDIESGKISHVLCWRLDRWFRSLKDVVNTLSYLTSKGVIFISLKDGIDLGSSTGRLMANLLACFAQFELEVIRERVKSGLENARRKGRIGGRRRRIDYDKVLLLKSQGLTLNQIAKIVKATPGAISKTLKKSQLAPV